jgi:SAM-dependent methyltransferase
VGAGDRPYRGVTHVVELHPDVSHERYGPLRLPKGALLVQGSLEELPFCDGAFTAVYARHVLEHVSDASRAARELSRVGLRGYVETPSPLYELLSQPLPYVRERSMHHWFIWSKGDDLHAARKHPSTMRALCTCENGRAARAIVDARWSVRDREAWQFLVPSAKYTKLVWRGRVDVAEHATLADACATGACALASAGALARALRRRAVTPEHRLLRAELDVIRLLS